MSEAAWRFRTTEGVVTVGSEAIDIRSTPGQFLAGQRAGWRNGNRRERAMVALTVGGFLFSIVGLVYHVSLVAETGVGWSAVLYGSSVATFAYALWAKHARPTSIPRSNVEAVTLDADERQLTITYRTGDGPLRAFRDDEIETTLALPTTDDLREAHEIFRLRGIALAAPDASETETTYRFVTRSGVCFCERCRSQVSPSDGTCPACSYALRVETNTRDAGNDAREATLSFRSAAGD